MRVLERGDTEVARGKSASVERADAAAAAAAAGLHSGRLGEYRENGWQQEGIVFSKQPFLVCRKDKWQLVEVSDDLAV